MPLAPSSAEGSFQPTIWSTIIKAKAGDEITRKQAMERLLERYRGPILVHIRAGNWGRGSPEDAEDLCHGFIQQCLALDFLRKVGPEQGRFRTFIKTCLNHYLSQERRRQAAKKRPDFRKAIPLAPPDESGFYPVDPPSADPAPDERLDREWALNVLRNAMSSLQEKCRSTRRERLFEALQGQLGRAPSESTVAQIAAQLQLTPNAVNVEMHRLRRTLGECIREEVRETVGTRGDWREELRYLVELLGR